ncbi:MAG: twin-arginine translocase subunit TatC [Chloroflexi bacterium]|nr:MAG: twin-arginine translocase subunit TatC [Chloroflexota bacterium]
MAATTSERDKELSLVQHLGELRDRLMVAGIAVLITTIIAFLFSVDIVRILLVPVNCEFFHVDPSHFPYVTPEYICHETRTKLIALSPTENFTTFLRVSLFSGIALAMPVILFEIYAYIDPALFPKERRFVRLTVLPVLGLFLTGMAFCYFILLPNAIKFLINFGGDVIENQLRASDYISFVTTFILGVGLVFEVPAIIYTVVRVGVVPRSWLTRQRRYVFLLAFVVGAVITPTPDPFNQTLVAVPMYLLFELGLFLARFVPARPAAA